MIAHYINKGYPVDKLMELSYDEKLFFVAAMQNELELQAKMSGLK